MPQTKTQKPDPPAAMDEKVSVPMERVVREAIDRLAKSEDRFPGSMARILLKEALRARGELPDAA